MPCSLPPPLTDEQLLDALDDESNSQVLHHLENCAYCSARLKEMMHAEQLFKSRFGERGWLCYSSELLGEYAVGLLSQIESQLVKEHLETCPRCTEELMSIQQFMSTTEHLPDHPFPPQPSPRLYARLEVPEVLSMRDSRWTGSITRFHARADDLVLSIQIRRTLDGAYLSGEIAHPDWVDASLEVLREHHVLAESVLDEFGQFRDVGPISVEEIDVTLQITSRQGQRLILPQLPLGAADENL